MDRGSSGPSLALRCLPPHDGVALFLGAGGRMTMCLVPPKGLSVSMSSAAPCDVTVAGGRSGRETCCPRFPKHAKHGTLQWPLTVLRGGVGDSLKLDGPVAGISRRIVYEGPSSSWTRRVTTGMHPPPPRACPLPCPPSTGPEHTYTRGVLTKLDVCVWQLSLSCTPHEYRSSTALYSALFAGQKNNQYSRGRRRQWSARTGPRELPHPPSHPLS